MLEYKIEGRQITLLENKYWIFSGELNKYGIDQLNEVIRDIENVFENKYTSSSFVGEVVFTVEFNKDVSKIEYYSEAIGEEPTIDIYNMLKDFRYKLIEYEKTKKSS